MTKQTYERGWDVRNIVRDGVAQTIAIVHCRKCDVEGSINIAETATRHHIPKAFWKIGWDVDLRNKARAKCPDCNGFNKRRSLDNKEATPTMSDTSATKGAGDIFKMLSPSIKTSIRELLEGHFDVDKGYYLHSYSDQRIGADLNIPWAAVAYIRDLMYGPLKSDPEINAIRIEIQGEREELAKSLDRLAKTDARLKQLEDRLDKVSKRFSSGA